MHFEWLTSWDEIWSEEFQYKWENWINKSPTAHIFFHPAFVRAWVDTYRQIENICPRFVIVTDDFCTLFLPLVLWKRNWKNCFQKILMPAGATNYDYCDPICTTNLSCFEWKTFWNELEKAIDETWNDYDKIQIPGLTFSASEELNAQINDITNYLKIDQYNNIEDYLHTRTQKVRSELRRREKRLQEIGELSFRIYNELDELLRILPEFLELHAKKWPNAYKPPNFHSTLIRYTNGANLLRFSELSINGKAFSWRMCFRFKKTYYSYMPVYLVSYRKFSPGTIHLLKCINDAITKNDVIYDQLRGGENYKQDFMEQSKSIYTFERIRSNLISSSKTYMSDNIKEKIKKYI